MYYCSDTYKVTMLLKKKKKKNQSGITKILKKKKCNDFLCHHNEYFVNSKELPSRKYIKQMY